MTEREHADHSHGIRINIDGVTESEKLSALTVGQFVELLFQVNSQLSPARLTPDSKALSETIEAVRAIIAEHKNNASTAEIVHLAQDEILKRIPGIIHQAQTRKPNDGGPSPFAKGLRPKG
jgi:hypothetical protein